jgi:hypothetical protein
VGRNRRGVLCDERDRGRLVTGIGDSYINQNSARTISVLSSLLIVAAP